MRRIRTLVEKVRPLVIPDRAPDSAGRGASVLSRLSTPHTFGPSLSLGDALVAIIGTLTRIFGGCLFFALWGGISVFVWSSIDSNFWRVVVVMPLVLLFVAGLSALMIAVSLLERMIASWR